MHWLKSLRAKMNVSVINYLDDFLFISESRLVCDHLITQFILLCNRLGCLVSEEKTERANSQMIFLGILLDGKRLCLSIPDEKRIKAINALKLVIDKKKITVKTIQKVTGLLNFLQCAVVPGRTFMRRMYDKLRIKDKNGRILKQHHHVCLDVGFREDCSIWLKFLISNANASLYRPFVDFSAELCATTLAFYADASLNKNFGFGAVFGNRWICRKWGSEFIVEQEPSIEFLELFALTMGILTWGKFLKNFRMIVFSDNEAVCNIVNNMTSRGPNCMKLVRLLVLDNFVNNRRVFVRHIKSSLNVLVDSLSRLQFRRFWNHAPTMMLPFPDEINKDIWPIDKLWFS